MYFRWDEHCSVLYTVFEGVQLICIALCKVILSDTELFGNNM